MSRRTVGRVVLDIDAIRGPTILDHRMAHRDLAERLAMRSQGGGVEPLDPADRRFQRGIEEGIRVGRQHALRQVAWLGGQEPVEGPLANCRLTAGQTSSVGTTASEQ